LSQLFGTTSEADFQPIRDHIKHIAQGISHLDHGLQMQHNQFASFMEFSAQRMDSFRNLTTVQERAISDLYDEIHTMFNTETRSTLVSYGIIEDAEVHNTTTAHR